MIPSPFAPVQYGKQLSVSQIERIGRSLAAMHDMQGTGNLQYETGATGHQLIDQTMKPVLAIIDAGGGSGLGGAAASGSGNAGIPLPADDQMNAYSGVEGVWSVEDDNFVVIEKQDGMRFTLQGCPLVEANQVADVPQGAVVRAYPASALGYRFYYFFYTGEIGTGSGNDETLTVNCGDGSTTTYTIARTDDGYSATLVE